MTASLLNTLRAAGTALGRASVEERREGVRLLIQTIAWAVLEERGSTVAETMLESIREAAALEIDRITGVATGEGM
jgi:hypothetical protein